MSRILFTGRGGESASVHAGIPPEQTPPRTRHPPEQTPPAQCMPGDTVNKRAVCILLECNLVRNAVTTTKNYFNDAFTPAIFWTIAKIFFHWICTNLNRINVKRNHFWYINTCMSAHSQIKSLVWIKLQLQFVYDTYLLSVIVTCSPIIPIFSLWTCKFSPLANMRSIRVVRAWLIDFLAELITNPWSKPIDQLSGINCRTYILHFIGCKY